MAILEFLRRQGGGPSTEGSSSYSNGHVNTAMGPTGDFQSDITSTTTQSQLSATVLFGGSTTAIYGLDKKSDSYLYFYLKFYHYHYHRSSQSLRRRVNNHKASHRSSYSHRRRFSSHGFVILSHPPSSPQATWCNPFIANIRYKQRKSHLNPTNDVRVNSPTSRSRTAQVPNYGHSRKSR